MGQATVLQELYIYLPVLSSQVAVIISSIRKFCQRGTAPAECRRAPDLLTVFPAMISGLSREAPISDKSFHDFTVVNVTRIVYSISINFQQILDEISEVAREVDMIPNTQKGEVMFICPSKYQ